MSSHLEPTISVHNVSKSFKGKKTVISLTFEVYQGEVFGLLGCDEAGKSTTLQMISGLLKPDEGEIFINGLPLVKKPAWIKQITGYMPQGFNLYEGLTVEENIDFFASLYQIKPEKGQTTKDELLEITRLKPFSNRLAQHLSGGMKQKLALCCTLIHSPEIMILDEPTTGIDPISRRDLWHIVYQLIKDRKVTAILATAYMDEAEKCDRIALIHQGQIISCDTPKAVKSMVKGLKLEIVAKPQLEAIKLLQTQAPVKSFQILGERIDMLIPEEDNPSTWESMFSQNGIQLSLVKQKQPGLEDAFSLLLEESQSEAVSYERHSIPAYDYSNGQGITQAIFVEDLVKKFGQFTAVDHVSFSVKPGEIFGFLGPNGAGKTTVIKILCGIYSPSSGNGQVGGYNLSKDSRKIKKIIGYMSQKFSLYSDLSASENLQLYASIYGVKRSERRRRLEKIIEMAGLTGKVDQLTSELPLGFKQRLALGCALIHQPSILFLDEPTSGVDPLARRRFWDVIYTLSRHHGVTFMVTTHYMDEAEHCDTLALINNARIVAIGTPQELKDRAYEGLKSSAWQETTADELPSLEETFIYFIEKSKAVRS